MNNVLVRPFVTEKSAGQMDEGHYAFVVDKSANKIEIRKAVEAHYPGVVVADVRTMVVRGKRRRQMTKKGAVAGRRAGYKKAIVTLAAGSDAISFYEEV